jgi:hypothetical protein
MKNSPCRRILLLAVSVAISILGQPSNTHAAESAVDIKKLRYDAAHQKRRIIFDNDGNEVVYYMNEATPEALLKKRTTGVLNTQVDTIVYCTWSSGFSYFTHNTKAGVPFVTTAEEPGKGPGSGFSKNKAQALFDQGLDPLTIVTDYCRKNDIEIFWSMRMNDIHDAWGAWYSPYLFPPVKTEHPEWLVGTKEKRPNFGTWSSVDFAVPEIRDMAFQFFEEVCNNYDVDGVELDFFRHPIYFKSFAWEGTTTPEERQMMTDLLARIRTMADEVGEKRGRPILITVRVPDSADYCRDMGLDIERWMQDGLIDILVPSGYFRLRPWEDSVALGKKYDIPVYPCLSESRIRDKESKAVRATLESYRARAMDVWQSGADGVYMFNFFHAPNPLWDELGDPAKLVRLNKVYTTGARGTRDLLNLWNKDGAQYMKREHLSPEYPRTVAPGETAGVSLRVDKPEPDATVILNLRMKEDVATDSLAVVYKDITLPLVKTDGAWRSYAVIPSTMHTGMNRIAFTNDHTGPHAITIDDMNLRVSYPAR